jgi:hypothetical protein
MHLEVVGAQPHALGAVERHRPQITALGELILARHVDAGPVQGGLVERQFHAEDLGRTEEAPGVRLQPEDGHAALGLVGADALENAQPVVQGVGQDMGGGIAPGHHFAVIPDDAVAVGHAHGSCSSGNSIVA